MDIVIHSNLPRNSETLIHRSGRTGRAGKHGLSIILFSPNSIKTYNRIIEHAKIVPKLRKNLSKKIIEDNENAQFLNKVSSISKSKIEDKLINELIKKNYDVEISYISEKELDKEIQAKDDKEKKRLWKIR